MIWLVRKLLKLAFLVAAIIAIYIGIDMSRSFLQAPVDVDIVPGTRAKKIAQQLADAGVIRSRTTFLALYYLNRGRSLKAGMYSFDHPVTPRDVLGQIFRGESSRQEVTIPEGFNRFAIAELLESKRFVKRAEFLQATEGKSLVADLDANATNLEGYLFPDTYQFPRHAGAIPIVRIMTNRFRKVYAGLKSSASQRPIREIVTMASLVETETGNSKERPLVASVFYNRLEKGIRLQCDPTVIYASTLIGKYDGTIHQSDLDLDSPYNTYVHTGLPPGPIANPGKASLLAAMNPAASDYLYFVADNTGFHKFSRTLAEHSAAVSSYRKGLVR